VARPISFIVLETSSIGLGRWALPSPACFPSLDPQFAPRATPINWAGRSHFASAFPFHLLIAISALIPSVGPSDSTIKINRHIWSRPCLFWHPLGALPYAGPSKFIAFREPVLGRSIGTDVCKRPSGAGDPRRWRYCRGLFPIQNLCRHASQAQSSICLS